MSWKNYHYWFRGGIIGILFLIFFYILISIFPSIVSEEAVLGWIFMFSFIPALFLLNLLGLDPTSWSSYLVGLINYFIYGAIIGLIVGAIKKKKGKK